MTCIIIYFCLCPTVYLYPNDSVIAICNVTTLTCVTNTGLLTWSTSIEKHGKTFITSSGLNTVSELGEHITVQLTNKDGSILTSVATITGSNSTLNEAMISCGDTRGTVRSKTLFIPGRIYIIHTTFVCMNLIPHIINACLYVTLMLYSAQ